MNIQKIFELCQFHIDGAVPYGWACYGQNAIIVDFDFPDSLALVTVMFDRKTQVVYEVEWSDNYQTGPINRWINPEYLQTYIDESVARGQVWNQLGDDEDDEEFIDIFNEPEALDQLERVVQAALDASTELNAAH